MRRNYRANEADRRRYVEQLRANPRRSSYTVDRVFPRLKREHPNTRLTVEELYAIWHYTGEGFRLINAVLWNDREKLNEIAADWNRSSRPDDPLYRTQRQLIAEGRADARMLTSALNGLPAYEGTVYCVTQLTDVELARYKVGETEAEPAFISTKANGFWSGRGNARFVIQSSSGRDVSEFSANPRESEVLFAPEVRFMVLAVEMDGAIATVYLKEER